MLLKQFELHPIANHPDHVSPLVGYNIARHHQVRALLKPKTESVVQIRSEANLFVL